MTTSQSYRQSADEYQPSAQPNYNTTNEILQPIEDSAHSAVLPVFFEALRSPKFITIDGGAVPVALENGEVYHGSFDKKAFRDTGKLVKLSDGKLDTTAFEIAARLVYFAQRSGHEASLSFSMWDVDGVPFEGREKFSQRLVTNRDLEAIPAAYKEVTREICGSRSEAAGFLKNIQILPQSKYGHSVSNIWRDVKDKIRKVPDVDAWARAHFEATGHIYLEAWEGDINFYFLSTPESRQPFVFKDSHHPCDRVQSEGGLPIALVQQTLCGPIAGGRMYEMRRRARAKSDLAKQQGVYSIHVQDVGIDTDSLQKIARGIYFQKMTPNANADKSAAYVLSAQTSTPGHVIQLPKAREKETFEQAIKTTCERISATMHLDNAALFRNARRDEKRLFVDQATQKAARIRFSWALNPI